MHRRIPVYVRYFEPTHDSAIREWQAFVMKLVHAIEGCHCLF